jgi:signal transduction histidine kinase
VYGSLQDTITTAIETVKSNPQFREIRVTVKQNGNVEGWFDHRKLERAFSNLLLNACESVDPHAGKIIVMLNEVQHGVQIKVSDNGHGIPASIRTTLFDPFVSQGKENGTGLGLTVVQKIVQDHGGEVIMEMTSPEGTVFCVLIPRPAPLSGASEQGTSEDAVPAGRARVNTAKPA